ncbi:MAG: hypothetical protein HY306_00395 [Nitrosomonadales bacterium]|nr:hypothetical protein [Nitrosomonadales bacterium]
MWFDLATQAGNEAAQKDQGLIEEKMSREQIEQARQLAQEWLGKHK